VADTGDSCHGMAVLGEAFGLETILSDLAWCRQGADAHSHMHHSDVHSHMHHSDAHSHMQHLSSHVMGQHFGAVHPADDMQESRLEQVAHLGDGGAGGGFSIDGFLFGRCTNIFSVLADPELEKTWERVALKDAALAVACLVQRDSTKMCHYMAHTDVPVMCVCSNNKEARLLYEAGATYALQQEFVASKELFSLLCAERANNDIDDFQKRADDHKDELDEENHDAVLKLVSKFI